MKILVADDERETARSIKNFLDKRGYSIDVAFEGREALDLIKKNNYDMVFLDHNMPGLTGLELIKFIKQNNLKAVSIMITGYPEMNKTFAKAIGADEYINKPCSLEEIENIIKKYSLQYRDEDG